MATHPEALARGWIEAWVEFDMAWLREHLAADFIHTSPFGTLRGRDDYLAVVEPLARKSVTELVVRRIVADDSVAALWFENHTPEGVVPTCDWVFVEDGRIREIRSFYDPAAVREALPDSDQADLAGGTAAPA